MIKNGFGFYSYASILLIEFMSIFTHNFCHVLPCPVTLSYIVKDVTDVSDIWPRTIRPAHNSQFKRFYTFYRIKPCYKSYKLFTWVIPSVMSGPQSYSISWYQSAQPDNISDRKKNVLQFLWSKIMGKSVGLRRVFCKYFLKYVKSKEKSGVSESNRILRMYETTKQNFYAPSRLEMKNYIHNVFSHIHSQIGDNYPT